MQLLGREGVGPAAEHQADQGSPPCTPPPSHGTPRRQPGGGNHRAVVMKLTVMELGGAALLESHVGQAGISRVRCPKRLSGPDTSTLRSRRLGNSTDVTYNSEIIRTCMATTCVLCILPNRSIVDDIAITRLAGLKSASPRHRY